MALLIEIGSAFGMYVAFAYWRINDRGRKQAPASAGTARGRPPHPWRGRTCGPVPAERGSQPAAEPLAAQEEQAAVEPPAPRRLNANDNRLLRAVPDSDVQRFYRERVIAAPKTRA